MKYEALSVATCFMGVAVAVNALEVLRLDRELSGKPPWKSIGLYLFSLNLGLVAVWLMHFCGMAALADPHTTLYDPAQTALSAGISIVSFTLGALVASTDPYFGMTVEEAVSKVGAQVSLGTLQSGRRGRTELRRTITLVGTHRLAGGAAISSAGVASMHFLGLGAARNTEFARSPGMVAGATALAFIACTVGYWVAFRLLQWSPNNERLRTASFVPLTLAICSAHYSAARVVRAPGEVPLPEGVDAEDLVSGGTIVEAGLTAGVLLMLSSCLVMMAALRQHAVRRGRRIREQTRSDIESSTKGSPDSSSVGGTSAILALSSTLGGSVDQEGWAA